MLSIDAGRSNDVSIVLLLLMLLRPCERFLINIHIHTAAIADTAITDIMLAAIIYVLLVHTPARIMQEYISISHVFNQL